MYASRHLPGHPQAPQINVFKPELTFPLKHATLPLVPISVYGILIPLKAQVRNLSLSLFPHNAHSICCQFCCFSLFQIQFLHNIHTDQRACTFRPYTFPWVSVRDKAEEPSTFPSFSFPTYLHLKYIYIGLLSVLPNKQCLVLLEQGFKF